jgi:Flp pilus assembly protein TadG
VAAEAVMAKRFLRLWKDKGGLAAVEFAFVAPVMLTFFFGLYETSQALLCRADVTNLASTGSDLIAQESKATDADMTNVFSALTSMLFPYDTSKATIVIASIVDNNVLGQGTVAWCNAYTNNARNDAACGTNGYGTGTVITLPNTSLITKGGGGSVIFSKIIYNYSSTVSSYFVGSVNMTNNFYAKPRRVAQIPRVAS